MTISGLLTALASIVTVGRSKVAYLKTLVNDRCSAEELAESSFELDVYRALKRAGVVEPEMQPLIETVHNRYRADFAWRAEGVLVEVDGHHHETVSRRRDDVRRDQDLASAGWVVLRCTRLCDVDEFVARLSSVLAARQLRPSKLHGQ